MPGPMSLAPCLFPVIARSSPRRTGAREPLLGSDDRNPAVRRGPRVPQEAQVLLLHLAAAPSSPTCCHL